jgi:hypothetical protein
VSVTLKPGDLGIDYSYARPNLAEAARSGARFVVRYSAGAASDSGHPSHAVNAGKLITPGEFKAILAAGMDVIANDEWYASRITEGAAAGTADAKAAGRLWKSVGLAKGASVYVSWDEYPSPSKFLAVARYERAYRKALAGYGYLPDAYGGTGFLKWALKGLLIKFGWRTNAGAWSGDGLPYQPDTTTASKRAALVQLALGKTPAAIWQTGNYWFNKSADEDLIVRVPVGSHLEALASATPDQGPIPVPPINDEEFILDADAKARFDRLDAEVADLKAAIRGALSDSSGKPHKLSTWLSKLAGKKVDLP